MHIEPTPFQISNYQIAGRSACLSLRTRGVAIAGVSLSMEKDLAALMAQTTSPKWSARQRLLGGGPRGQTEGIPWRKIAVMWQSCLSCLAYPTLFVGRC